MKQLSRNSYTSSLGFGLGNCSTR